MITNCPTLDQPLLARLAAVDPVVQDYRAFFALLDWSHVSGPPSASPRPGPPPQPATAYVKALVIKICEGKEYITQLRTFLVHHPLLVLEIGFRPVPTPDAPYGFAVERTVPCDRWLRHWQQHVDHAVLAGLLGQTVPALQAEIPGLGETASFDVKHLYAWVCANNHKAYVPDRYDPANQPAADPDCRLGVKTSSNQRQADGTSKQTKEYVWGYGSGVAAATDPRYGDVVLAEFTQPFNEVDSTYYHPLYARTVQALGRTPINVTADAAFDAWHIYQTCAGHGGMAAIPLNLRGHPLPQHHSDGRPLCPRGLPMQPSYAFRHTEGYQAQLYRCPLLVPARTDQTCDHEQFRKGPGCVKYVNLELGGQMRIHLDRASATYQQIYRQRTAVERINSQAKALGIERPKARNGASVRNLNTLIYIVINLRALARARTINAHPPACLTVLC